MSRTRGRTLPVGEHRTGAHATVWVEADRERPTGRELFVDGFSSSYVDLEDPTYLHYEYIRHLAALLDGLPEGPLDVVHVGGGACTLARWVQATRAGSRNLVYERDELVVRVARELLGLRTGGGLHVRVADGRAGVARRPDGSADAIVVDAFDGPGVPIALLTREFLADARRVLRDGGLYLLNLIDQPPLGTSRAAVATALDVFDDVAVVGDRTGHRANVILAAGNPPLRLQALRALLAAEGRRQRILRAVQLSGFTGGVEVLRDR